MLARLAGSRRFVRTVMLAALLASFAYAIWLTASKPTSAFFMLPARAWELLAGSLVYVYGNASLAGKSARALEALGLALIIGAFVTYDSSTPWPGHSAALPLLGACLVLLAARHTSLWTSNRVAQGLGRWSHSIYLWHWPLAVGLGYFGVRDETGWFLAAMAASIMLGALSYRLIKQPSARWMRGLDSRKAWRVTGRVSHWPSALLPLPISIMAWQEPGACPRPCWLPRTRRKTPAA